MKEIDLKGQKNQNLVMHKSSVIRPDRIMLGFVSVQSLTRGALVTTVALRHHSK